MVLSLPDQFGGGPKGLGEQPVGSAVHTRLAIRHPSFVRTKFAASIPQWLNSPFR